ncbi:MAG TPA: hypothetical protein PLD55_13825 [bacterium]|nr:hypothetical protein [bacterium]
MQQKNMTLLLISSSFRGKPMSFLKSLFKAASTGSTKTTDDVMIELFKKSGLRLNDKVMKVEIDPWKRKNLFEGTVTTKNSVPMVRITKGRKDVGVLVPWTPEWTPR